MEINPKIGFASIKVYAKGGVITSEPVYVHKLPVAESEDTIDVDNLEKDLLAMVNANISKHPPTNYEAKFGYFIKYVKEQYAK